VRSALIVELIVVEMTLRGCKPSLIAEVQHLYESSYKEGYKDGKTDCEELMGDEVKYYDE